MTSAESVGQEIWRHWQAGTVMDALPENFAPQTRKQAYAAQAVLEGFSTKARAGWKIAATSTAGQQHIGVSGPLAGRLLAEKLHEPGARLSLNGNRMRVAEPEFAFRFAQDITPRLEPYSVAEVLAAVADLHLTLELPDSRFADFASVGEVGLIADNACARELVVGPAVTADWRDVDLSSHTVAAEVIGRYERPGTGANVLGDPRVALAWCVNEVCGLGITLRAGELVTTGTSVPPLEIEPGDRVSANFGALGTIQVDIDG